MKFQDAVKKINFFLAITGCHAEEFNDLSPYFSKDLRV